MPGGALLLGPDSWTGASGGWCGWAPDETDMIICPVAGLLTVEGLVSDDAGGEEDDSSILDIAEASSFNFSSDNCERIDFIPLDWVTVLEDEVATRFLS